MGSQNKKLDAQRKRLGKFEADASSSDRSSTRSTRFRHSKRRSGKKSQKVVVAAVNAELARAEADKERSYKVMQESLSRMDLGLEEEGDSYITSECYLQPIVKQKKKGKSKVFLNKVSHKPVILGQ